MNALQVESSLKSAVSAAIQLGDWLMYLRGCIDLPFRNEWGNTDCNNSHACVLINCEILAILGFEQAFASEGIGAFDLDRRCKYENTCRDCKSG